MCVDEKVSKTRVDESSLREELVEELVDVLMYYNDVLLCYGISEDELKQAYTSKFEKNMKRWLIPIYGFFCKITVDNNSYSD